MGGFKKIAIKYMAIDSAFIFTAYLLAYIIITSGAYTGSALYENLMKFLYGISIVPPIYLTVLLVFKMYRGLWIYAGIDEFILALVVALCAGTISNLYMILSAPAFPESAIFLGSVFASVFLVGIRMSPRVYERAALIIKNLKRKNFKRVLIVGAGSCGMMILKEIKSRQELESQPIGFIDDDKNKLHLTISGVEVLGNRHSIGDLVRERDIVEIIIAIPSIKSYEKKEILDICMATGCKVKVIPSINELISEKVSLSHIRNVETEELLGREPVKLDNDKIAGFIKGRRVLVTGGGGSIGSELCRQIARFRPEQLIVLDVYENTTYELENELRANFKGLKIKIIIATVRDIAHMDSIFKEYRPEVVFHAAAHKHVPLMENNPAEAIKNNVFGTLNTIRCADKYKTKHFIMISTDKAVNPTNVMGVTKRICELIVQGISGHSSTEFAAVRFGNVLGSNGSVIPLFKKQIEMGGPVTVTNKHITRFFMTIPEAVQLVIQAGAFAKGGEIFVLDMGKPVKIYDLACQLIKLSGFVPNKDIKIEITGRRPGEKLYEELLLSEEGLDKTCHEKIFVGKVANIDYSGLLTALNRLEKVVDNSNVLELHKYLQAIVPEFNSAIINKIDMAYEEIAAEMQN